MSQISKILSAVVSFTIINVWLFRANQSTPYRGGNASSLYEEFEVYGLSDYFLIIGIIKVSLAALLLAGIFYKKLTVFAASGIAIMMLIAAYSHFSVGDEFMKALPSSVMLLSCIIIIISSLKK
tara:strand:- start:6018 stop:6389 length:372 start_codon:yes stop_codon:yes gene_type:complete